MNTPLIDPTKCTTPAETGIERLRALYAIMRGVPDERIDLATWRGAGNDIPDKTLTASWCGSAACAIGWVTAHPEFKAIGFHFRPGLEEPILVRPGGPHLYGWEAISKVFSINHSVASYLFSASSEDAISDIILSKTKGMGWGEDHLSHRGKVLQRIRRVLLERGAITSARNRELEREELALA